MMKVEPLDLKRAKSSQSMRYFTIKWDEQGTGWMDADTDKKWPSLLWIRGTRPCELDCALITSLSIRYRILRLVFIFPVFWKSSLNKQPGISRGSYSLICQYHTMCSILDVSTAVRALSTHSRLPVLFSWCFASYGVATGQQCTRDMGK